MDRWGHTLQAAVRSCYHHILDRYIDPPLPTHVTISHVAGYREYELVFHFPPRMEPYFVRIGGEAINLSGHGDPRRITEQFNQFIIDNLSTFILDVFSDADKEFCARTFHHFLSTSLPHYSYQNREIYDQLLQDDLTRHYQLMVRGRKYLRPFFSLRDVDREYDYWVIDPNRAEPTRPAPLLPTFVPQANQEEVRAARERVRAMLLRVLNRSEDPRIFRERNYKLDQIEHAQEELRLRELFRRGGPNFRMETINWRDFYEMRWDLGAEPNTAQYATEVRYRQEQHNRAIRRLESEWDRAFQDALLFGMGAYRTDKTGRSPEAEARGLKLLEENLSPSQLVQWKKEKKFVAIGGQSGDKYEIHSGYNRNVYRITKSRQRKGLCFLPAGNLCIGDTLLAQKIGIELHEDEILRVAIPFNV